MHSSSDPMPHIPSDSLLATAIAAVVPALPAARLLGETLASVPPIQKGDGSPVTAADYVLQALVVAGLRARSADGRVPLFGEEHADVLATSGRPDVERLVVDAIRSMLGWRDRAAALRMIDGDAPRAGEPYWTIDPIDGTKNFVRGVPVWATLIALRERGQITLGLVSAPALGRRWWATTGHGAWVRELEHESPRRIRVSSVQKLVDASFSFSDQTGWNRDQFEAIRAATWRQRAYGDFWSHMLLGEGAIDVSAEPKLALYDYAALVPIVAEAGGTVSQFNGDELPIYENESHPSFICTNGALHRDCVNLLNNRT